MHRALFPFTGLLGLAALSYFVFPGHTILQSDTQIYLPILEHYWDSSALSQDMIVRNPHVSFTVYDEVAIGLRRLTGLSFEAVLALQQVIFRWLGFLGVYLIATSMGLSVAPALFVTAVHALGAWVSGPMVLVVEYEPIPRGFAVSLLLLAIGLAAHGRDWLAGVAASLAFLYHAPTVWPFWLVYFVLTLWPGVPAVMSRHVSGLAPLFTAVLILFALSRLQAGIGEPQQFLAQADQEWERLLRSRAPYNWVSIWLTPGSNILGWWLTHYLLLWGLTLIACWRLWRYAATDLKFFLIGMPLLGMLSVPVSYICLDRLKWVFIPQAQPARALLFAVAFAVLLGAVAAVRAMEQQRYWETALWLLAVFAVPMQNRVLELFMQKDPLARRRFLVAVLLCALTMASLWLWRRFPRAGTIAVAGAAIVPFFTIPAAGRVTNNPRLHTPELAQLSAWARSSTPMDAVFLFPDAGSSLTPGIFRARALRAVYVDQKMGGQVNFLREFGMEWWRRWQDVMGCKLTPETLAHYREVGIDFIVVKPANRLANRSPVFENATYLVYHLTDGPPSG